MLSIIAFLYPVLASAAAYLDPGSGSFLIQLLIAGGAALILAFATQWNRIKRLFRKKNNPVEPEGENEVNDECQQPKA